MRLPFLRAAAVLALFAAGGCAFEPRYPIEPGAPPGRGVVVDQPAYPIDPPPDAPRAALAPPDAAAPALTPAVDYVDATPLWTLASTRHPTLRHRLEADADSDAPRKGRRGSRAAKARSGEAETSAAATVTVRAGDTLYSLAGRNHATVEAVAKLNGLKPPYALAPGLTLKLPTPMTYVAKTGDTVSAVADRYGVTESLLRKANPDLSGDRLKRGAKLVLPASAKASGADEQAKSAPPAASETAAAPDGKACPRRKGRKACLAAAKTAQASAQAPAAVPEVAAFDLKACRRHHTRRACAAQAKVAEASAASAQTQEEATAPAAFDLRACRRHQTRRACAAQAKAAEASAAQTAAVSSRKASAAVADAEQALKDCRRHHRRRACAAEAKAVTEGKAVVPVAPASGRQAADAATAALNLKACRRRHSRSVCEAQAAAARGDAPEATVASTTRKGRDVAAAKTAAPSTPEVSAESMVASLPSAPGPGRVRSTLAAPSETVSVPTAGSLSAPVATNRLAAASVGDSPGPRPYASVFGAGASSPVAASGRRARDRSARTSQDAQAAAAAAARRDYARASLPAVPLTGGADGSGKPRFAWPVSGEVISGFGPKGSGLRNDGVDLAASLGDPVKASAAGEVVYAGGAIPGFGNLVLVKHAGGYVTAYGHLSKISVAMRQAVRQGDVVGEVGQTGAVARPELHFEIRFAATPEENAKPVDPAPLLPRRG